MTRDGLLDTEKILVTFALWLSAVALFAAAVTLPMLPDYVAMYYHPENMPDELTSKYNNLLLTVSSVIPAVIILIAMALKMRHRLHNNFVSIIIVGIMLALCMSGIVIYGIMRQMGAVDPLVGINKIDVNVLISLSVCAVLSMLSAGLPFMIHSPIFTARAAKRKLFVTFFFEWLSEYWMVGAFGYLLTAIACSFVPDFYTYIPLGVFTLFMAIFVPVCAYKKMKNRAELELFELLDKE